MQNKAKKVDFTKEEKIQKEIRKYRQIFKDLPQNQKKIIETLINKAAFMGVSLEELQEAINEKGYVESYQNGENQKGYKKCSEVEIYNTMIKNYTSTINQMYNMLPNGKAEEIKKAGEELVSFLARGKPGSGKA